jgi:hypothetical protein
VIYVVAYLHCFADCLIAMIFSKVDACAHVLALILLQARHVWGEADAIQRFYHRHVCSLLVTLLSNSVISLLGRPLH